MAISMVPLPARKSSNYCGQARYKQGYGSGTGKGVLQKFTSQGEFPAVVVFQFFVITHS